MSLKLSVKFRGREYKSPKRGLEAYRAFVNESFENSVREMKPEMRRYIEEIVNVLIERNSTPYPGGTTDNSLSKRSGRSIAALAEGIKVSGNKLDTLRASFSIPLPLAYHEYGYNKRSNGKLLTIPLPAALNPNGTPKKPNARNWQDTFVTESRKGNLIIFQRRGKRIIPLYVLKDSVRAPPRLGARKLFKERIPHFQERLADDIAAAFT